MEIFTVIPWYAWIAIVGIISGSVVKLVEMRHRHIERLAMIQSGLDPNQKPAVRGEV